MAKPHERQNEGATSEWLTPPEIIRELGPFDLDPASPVVRPWDTAARHFSKHDDGLSMPWDGRVWLNPPYGPHVRVWLKKLADHGDGIALIFARTDTAMFAESIWDRASGLFFIRGRLRFRRPDGSEAASRNAGAPSVLVAYGAKNAECLDRCTIGGRFVRLKLN